MILSKRRQGKLGKEAEGNCGNSKQGSEEASTTEEPDAGNCTSGCVWGAG